MLDDQGRAVAEAGPSTPVEVLGLDGVPDAGEIVQRRRRRARPPRRSSSTAATQRRKKELAGTTRVSLENILDKIKAGDVKELKVVLKADVQGSVEALANALTKLSTDEVKVNVISAGVGGITERDVNLAKASRRDHHRLQRPSGGQGAAARRAGGRRHQALRDHLRRDRRREEGDGRPARADAAREVARQAPRCAQVFTIPKVGTIAGCFVTDGKIKRKAQLRLVRDSVVVYTGKVGSLRRFKDDVREVAQGYECGIGIEGYNDIKEGDVIEAFEIESVAPTLEDPTGASARR